MAEDKMNKSPQSFPMNGGDGRYSYTKNSSYQRGVVDATKEMINLAISQKLDIKHPSPNSFRIADLGCSVGPNTFISVQNIVEAVELKYQSQGLNSHIPEFEVFFIDQAANDFNTLFTSLPPNRRYFGRRCTGFFYGRLFSKASLHFVHSSYSIHWLSKVPKEVVDENSTAWNKGRINYTNAPNEVFEAYFAQYTKDMESFLYHRAEELVCGGLMVLVIQGRPNGTLHSQATPNMLFDLVGSSLMDMAKMSVKPKVDSFNLPIYTMSPRELEAVCRENGQFTVERMEQLPRVVGHSTATRAQSCTLHIRAAMERLLKEHFGHEILDELFDRYCKKLEEHSFIFDTGKGINIFALLKRKETD
ncbi:hypothetical protein HHK36_031977 [Tetracentron sinense]|uniref:S-adenosylmethionine-dependent methyltransferase n=1 Tax=Tetracentron sinense TaxID=13715 RepID=A0A835D0V5_TETSI|nr:hypothetical protein HHK36_031977 [Tetracentron sinense]